MRNGRPTIFSARVYLLAAAFGAFAGAAPVAAAAGADEPPHGAASAAADGLGVVVVPDVLEGPAPERRLRAARSVREPLFPIGGAPTAEETAALNAALDAFERRVPGTGAAALEAFARRYPGSAWTPSVQLSAALDYRHAGFFSRALALFDAIWRAHRDSSEQAVKPLADAAAAELAGLYARLGRQDELAALLDELNGRDVRGSAGEKVAAANLALAIMRGSPGLSFRCGPIAVRNVLTEGTFTPEWIARTDAEESIPRGTSLLQNARLAAEVGLDLRPVFRTEGPIPTPSVVHWRSGHFAALARQAGDWFLLKDPTFSMERWIHRSAILDETSGYFLVGGEVARGWRSVPEDEAAEVWGRGVPHGHVPNPHHPGTPTAGCCASGGCPPGMPHHDVHLANANLTISDQPVGYRPPVGPGVEFVMKYNHREEFQPTSFSFTNLGHKWAFDWISYVVDDDKALNDPAQVVEVYVRGSGVDEYGGYNTSTQTFPAIRRVRNTLTRVTASEYRLNAPDGSSETFGYVLGSGAGRRVFLTKATDAQGNSIFLQYETTPAGNVRLLHVRDRAPGDPSGVNLMSLSYTDADPLKVTRVTDRYGRYASLSYESGRLASVTDVIGMRSTFTYGAGDFVTALTTPYGTSRFTNGTVPQSVSTNGGLWVEVMDPLGGRERVEYRHGDHAYPPTDPLGPPPELPHNNDFLNLGLTAHWDKRAMALHPGDYSKAHLTNWIQINHKIVPIKREEKRALENRVWYAYAGQNVHLAPGHLAVPTKVGRLLGGVGSASQVTFYEYNDNGQPTKVTDPIGRETVYEYASNGIDLLTVKQKNGAAYEVIRSSTYNSQHQPLTSTDAAGQTTTYTYNAAGQIATIVTPPRAGLTVAQRTTTYAYDAGGFLLSITGPGPEAVRSFTYDAFGRMRTSTDVDGYTITYDYDVMDRPTRVTYPDGTFEQTVYNRLDVEKTRDREGRWTHTTYDAVRRPVATRDPLGRTTVQEWCTCGSLDKLIDARGKATRWNRDVQGRVTQEIRPDNATWSYTYDPAGRLSTRTDAKGQVATYQYTVDDKLQQVSYSGGAIPTPTVSYAYSPFYDRLTSMTDGTGTTTYTYHPVTASPTLGATQLASVIGPLAGSTVSYTFDADGRIASRGLSGFVSTMNYDLLGRLSSQGTPVGTFTPAYEGVTSRVSSLAYPNGQVSNYSYFPAIGDHRLSQIRHAAPGGATISQYDYTYDPAGSIATWRQQVGTNPAKLYNFTYDAAEQLATAQVTGPSPLPVPSRYSYAYDKAGNRTGEQLDDAATLATYDDRNRLLTRQGGGALLFRGTLNEPASVTVGGTSATVAADNTFSGHAQVPTGTSNVVVTATDPSNNTRTNTYQVSASGATTLYTHDANGNMTGDGTKTYEWDAENRLVAVKQGAVTLATFTYDGNGRRATKYLSSGSNFHYVYDGADIIEQRDLEGTTIKYVRGPGIDQHWAMRDTGGTVTYFLADHLGSVVQTTNAAGAVTLARDYDAYGNMLSGAGQSGYAYTGREWDSETGLYYYRARYYDSATGRFVSEDPIGLDGEDVNFYAYVWNSPTNFIDPEGLKGVPRPPTRRPPPRRLAPPPRDVRGPASPSSPSSRTLLGGPDAKIGPPPGGLSAPPSCPLQPTGGGGGRGPCWDAYEICLKQPTNPSRGFDVVDQLFLCSGSLERCLQGHPTIFPPGIVVLP